jgi:hypothetical protein
MRHIGLFILSAGLLLVSPGWAAEWSKTFTVSGKSDLTVKTSDADIKVDTWDQNAIEARVTTEHFKIGEGGVTIHDTQNGDAVELEVRFPRIEHFRVGIRRGDHVVVEIHMPRQGQVNLHTGDGSIQLANLKGTMDLESGDGNLEVSSVDGVLRAHSGDGRIRAVGRFDGLELKAGDGRVETRAEAGSSLGSGWNVETGDGNVSLVLPAHFAADLELQSGDGHINLGMQVTVEGKLKSNHIHGTINGGGGPLRVHTGDGSIELKAAQI